ncbi:unnamed protein product [Dovyalis caffra]|uniref:RING-type E3 ubiquitin transferase n=1 Tax=Dovyalis caffra TaxID=77055 RepID=A0AAV1RHV7_9ROSI|nr:unnamed protein product [Dovyalis caffra]
MEPPISSLSSYKFLAKTIKIQFIIAQESQDSLEAKNRVPALTMKRRDLVMKYFKEEAHRELYRRMGMELPSRVQAGLFESISLHASSFPDEADHMIVCPVFVSTSKLLCQIKTGIHVDEDEAVTWDLVDPFSLVLRACKPPIPCLKKVKITQNLGSEGGSCCAICLEDLPVGSEAAITACSHVYLCHCIVKWVMKRTSCPMCRSKLP